MKQEIENKLREIGYTGKTDLETILEALPAMLPDCSKLIMHTLDNTGRKRIYYFGGKIVPNKYPQEDQQENESLADTASRLLIRLFEAGIINFNEK